MAEVSDVREVVTVGVLVEREPAEVVLAAEEAVARIEVKRDVACKVVVSAREVDKVLCS